MPSDAIAAALVLTVVNPSGFGQLTLYPAGATPPLTSTIHFNANHVRTNNAILPLGANGQVEVECATPSGSTGHTHFVLDVFGCFK